MKRKENDHKQLEIKSQCSNVQLIWFFRPVKAIISDYSGHETATKSYTNRFILQMLISVKPIISSNSKNAWQQNTSPQAAQPELGTIVIENYN